MGCINVNALNTCDSNELARLKKLAEKVEFDYTYKIKEINTSETSEKKYAEFTIKAINLNSEIEAYIYDGSFGDSSKVFKRQSDNTATIGTFNSGEKITIVIDAYVNNGCSGKRLLTKTIKLPYYNIYSGETICKTYNECDVCNQIIDYKNYDLDEFENKLQECIKEKNKKLTYELEKKENNDINNNSYLYYYIGGALGLVIIIGLIFLVIRKRNKKLI